MNEGSKPSTTTSTGPNLVATVDEMLAVALRHLQNGGPAQAEQIYRQILQVEASHADAWFFLGAACQMQGNLRDARSHYEKAIDLRPSHGATHYNLGFAYEQDGMLDNAVASYRQALRIEPSNLAALNNLGNVFKAQCQRDDAAECYREVLRLRPDFAEVHANLGNVLADQEKLVEAENSYRQALHLRPDYAEAHYNLALLFAKSGKTYDAIAAYQQALSLKPDYVEAHVNLGNALRLTGQMDEALASFGEALRRNPNSPSAHWNRALVLLSRGNFDEGWPEYEWRWAQHSFARRHFAQPLWDGSDLSGKTIFLYAEQGLGDTLHFIRYAPLVKQRGGKVIVECQPQLLQLLSEFPGVECLVAHGSPLPQFDIQAPLLSIPGILHTTLGTIPSSIPYFHADAKLIERWRRELESRDRFRIGIAWQGNAANPGDSHRSIPLAHFAILARIPGVRLISLQKGPGTQQLNSIAESIPVLDLASRLDETSGAFMDTAAVMMNLDLVITSDTAVAHLAGALGVPVWVALAFASDWRWLLQREDSPWYPTMRLFRQVRFGDWRDVFERIAEVLVNLTQKARRGGTPTEEAENDRTN
jgi:tetratricopeptide (TPR) repeat protein